MLPTLIVLVVHFDLTPTTQASERYNSAVVSSKFQAAPRTGTIILSTIRGTESSRTIDINPENKTNILDSNLQYHGQGDMVWARSNNEYLFPLHPWVCPRSYKLYFFEIFRLRGLYFWRATARLGRPCTHLQDLQGSVWIRRLVGVKRIFWNAPSISGTT